MNFRSGGWLAAGKGSAASPLALPAGVGIAATGAASEGGAGACRTIPLAVDEGAR